MEKEGCAAWRRKGVQHGEGRVCSMEKEGCEAWRRKGVLGGRGRV
jgi:hypothetical protein